MTALVEEEGQDEDLHTMLEMEVVQASQGELAQACSKVSRYCNTAHSRVRDEGPPYYGARSQSTLTAYPAHHCHIHGSIGVSCRLCNMHPIKRVADLCVCAFVSIV